MATQTFRMAPLAILASAALALGVIPASAADDVPEGTRYMTTGELWKIYHNRSWIWADGAGYFPNTKRRFTAFSKDGRDASYAEGSWFVTWMGKACFRARWIGVDYDAPKLTCFSHRTDGKVIYQKSLPDGEWYVFKSNPGSKSDEFAKLVLGDYVSKGLKRNKQAIENYRSAGAPAR